MSLQIRLPWRFSSPRGLFIPHGTVVAFVNGKHPDEMEPENPNGGNDGHSRVGVAGASPDRSSADMAVQQRLGLLPERRAWAGSSHRADPCPDRTNLKTPNWEE